MVNPLAALTVHFTFLLIISGCTADGDAALVSDGYTPFLDIGVAYKYFVANVTWGTARKQCIREGGNLAVIDSMKKVNYAKSLAHGRAEYWFVGIHRYSTDTEYVNVKTAADTSLSNHSMVLPEGYTAFPDIGVAYKYFDDKLTWDSARKNCMTKGGNLAVINSVKKKEYANKLVPADRTGPYVGIHRLFDKSEWVDVKTGSPVVFLPWSNRADLNDTSRLCASLLTTGLSRSVCNVERSHMCEVPLFNNTTDHRELNTDHTRSPKTVTELPTGYTIFLDVGVAYKFYGPTKVTWDSARKYCLAHGANLAIIDSYEKYQRVNGLRGTSNGHVHVGMHRLFDKNEWIDVKNALPAVAIPWRNDNYVDQETRQCMSFFTDSTDIGLYAGICDYEKMFVCEVSLFRE